MKKLTAFFLALTLLATPALSVSAAEAELISPYYINTSQASISFGITEDGSASWTIICSGKSTATAIDSVSYLERKIGNTWVRVDLGTTNDEYIYNVSTKYLVKTHNATVSVSGTYRAVVEFTVYGTSEDETITLYKLYDY